MTTLLLFDIDGTLVLTGGAGTRAMSSAFEELFGIADAFHGVPMPGRTDTWLLSRACAAQAIPPDSPHVARFPDVYLRHLATELEKPGPRKGLMPGVRDVLEELSTRNDVHLALLTGNYEAAARLKLEYFDLWRYFHGGAFGDDAPDRNELVPRAVHRIASSGGPSIAARDAIVIGDTPLDVACAAAAGARSIAVATGSYSVEQLRDAGADIVFEDLSNMERVVEALCGRRAATSSQPSTISDQL